MADGDRAAVRIHVRRVVRQAELARDRQPLRGEGLVQLDHVDLADRQTVPRQQLVRRRRRADAMIRGGTPATAMPSTRAFGVRPSFAAADSLASSSATAPSFTPEALPRSPSRRLDHALELGERLERRLARMLVIGDDRVALPARIVTGAISPV